MLRYTESMESENYKLIIGVRIKFAGAEYDTENRGKKTD